MGAGEDDGVEVRGFGEWADGRRDRFGADTLAGELGLGELDQLGRAVADDGAVGRRMRAARSST